jgi:hypothetical protein
MRGLLLVSNDVCLSTCARAIFVTVTHILCLKPLSDMALFAFTAGWTSTMAFLSMLDPQHRSTAGGLDKQRLGTFQTSSQVITDSVCWQEHTVRWMVHCDVFKQHLPQVLPLWQNLPCLVCWKILSTPRSLSARVPLSSPSHNRSACYDMIVGQPWEILIGKRKT